MSESTANWALTHVDLLSERYGGQALSCNDEFFAQASNLTLRREPIFIDDKYTDRGKWMDGWETRRRRTEGYDWCILRLGLSGVVRAINVDTTFFKGNAPAEVSIEVCRLDAGQDPNDSTQWSTLLERIRVKPHSHNFFEILSAPCWTHLRLNIFPDGGVARLRVYGEPEFNIAKLLPNEIVDLAASTNGGRALACSDMFFSPMNNLVAPGRGINMGDGWETRRRRTAGHDWIVVKLAAAGFIKRVVVDTCHFKGNYPDSFTLEAAYSDSDNLAALNWVLLIDNTKLKAHSEHVFQQCLSDQPLLNDQKAFTHVRLNIYPDGGVSRLRIFGEPVIAP